jgi:hypothetical protein
LSSNKKFPPLERLSLSLLPVPILPGNEPSCAEEIKLVGLVLVWCCTEEPSTLWMTCHSCCEHTCRV